MKHLNELLLKMNTSITEGLKTMDSNIDNLPDEYKGEVTNIKQMIVKGIATQDKALLEEAIKRSNTLKNGLNSK